MPTDSTLSHILGIVKMSAIAIPLLTFLSALFPRPLHKQVFTMSAKNMAALKQHLPNYSVKHLLGAFKSKCGPHCKAQSDLLQSFRNIPEDKKSILAKAITATLGMDKGGGKILYHISTYFKHFLRGQGGNANLQFTNKHAVGKIHEWFMQHIGDVTTRISTGKLSPSHEMKLAVESYLEIYKQAEEELKKDEYKELNASQRQVVFYMFVLEATKKVLNDYIKNPLPPTLRADRVRGTLIFASILFLVALAIYVRYRHTRKIQTSFKSISGSYSSLLRNRSIHNELEDIEHQSLLEMMKGKKNSAPNFNSISGFAEFKRRRQNTNTKKSKSPDRLTLKNRKWWIDFHLNPVRKN